MSKVSVFINGRVFSSTGPLAQDADFLDAFMVTDGSIAYVGYEKDEEIQKAIADGAQVIDLGGRVVLPSFIDSHSHLLQFGLSLRKVDLSICHTLDEIRSAISQYAKSDPDLPRILCRGWHQPASGGKALASMIDDIDSRPIFIEALDLHSTWCNSAALKEMQVEGLANPKGGTIYRDADGHATGLLDESAHFGIVWPHLMNICTTEDKMDALQDAVTAYVDAGYAGLIDMAMDKPAWQALRDFRSQRELPIHIAAHWFIPFDEDFDQVQRHLDEAIGMNKEFNPSISPTFCVVGIKVISDGVVDGCTAALSHPYKGHTDPVEPIWPLERLKRAVKIAAKAGLQVAIHAIGDVAINQAITAIECANTPNGRHRIEHLELTTVEDMKRLGELGITASVQPVHSDPALTKAYPSLVRPELWNRAFPYRELLEHAPCLAIGTDAPTANHLPLPNLYNATTRRSATQPDLIDTVGPEFAITLSQAVSASTSGAAYSRFAETWTGGISKGHRADFVVLDMEWDPQRLLQAKVRQNWIAGEIQYDLTLQRT